MRPVNGPLGWYPFSEWAVRLRADRRLKQMVRAQRQSDPLLREQVFDEAVLRELYLFRWEKFFARLLVWLGQLRRAAVAKARTQIQRVSNFLRKKAPLDLNPETDNRTYYQENSDDPRICQSLDARPGEPRKDVP